jgi:hypothetical protein
MIKYEDEKQRVEGIHGLYMTIPNNLFVSCYSVDLLFY